ncbi:MAG: efflux RND transporter periplasmic adaptor subunit [Phaeodactylibacter sp.]|nr:efflux RND transporter periplasmic adaptor subunit [Phaeodactylibacter sp.]MCB9302321.1 efflux RND transporter periplasmic adaptor subunit [Lewinellaceae bacterium]
MYPSYYTTSRCWLVLVPALLMGCGSGEAGGEKTPAESRQAVIQRLDRPAEVAALGEVIPEKEVLELSFEGSGRIQSIYFGEGQRAQANDPLIVLDAALEGNQLQALDAQLESIRLEQEDARALAAYYREVLVQQEQTYQRRQRSVDANALPASELDQIGLDLKNTRNQIASQERRLRQLDAQAQEVRIKKEEVRLLQKQKILKAPGEGTVLEWKVREGATVAAYEVVGEFAPAGPLIVEGEVDEYFATQVEVGQPAILRREGYPDTLASGQVIFTAPNLSRKSLFSADNSEFEDLQVRRIKIRVEDGSRLLLGMKVEAVIKTGNK